MSEKDSASNNSSYYFSITTPHTAPHHTIQYRRKVINFFFLLFYQVTRVCTLRSLFAPVQQVGEFFSFFPSFLHALAYQSFYFYYFYFLFQQAVIPCLFLSLVLVLVRDERSELGFSSPDQSSPDPFFFFQVACVERIPRLEFTSFPLNVKPSFFYIDLEKKPCLL